MSKNEVIFISPMYNAENHLADLVNSLNEQRNENWKCIIVDDMSTDNSWNLACELTRNNDHFQIRKNQEKRWGLQNVVRVAREYENSKNTIIAIIDADDALCNENTVDLLLKAYEDPELDAAWTAHTWDINSINISKELPENVNPYQHPWCTSHLKTFRSTILLGIDNKNFKNLDGEWFQRGYDQALYLPILYLSNKRSYIDEICYLYRINSSSIGVRVWSEKDQMDTVRLVRARGFV